MRAVPVLLLGAAGLAAAAGASAAPAPPAPAPTTAPATTTAPGTGTTTTGTGTDTTTATTPPAPPVLSSLKLPSAITAPQGHAEILVGASTSTPARLRVQIEDAATKRLVRTVTAPDVHPAGRVYLHIHAVTEQRYQLPAGTYRVSVQATDPLNRRSNTLTGTFRLKLTTPRGVLDAYTVPLFPSIAKQHRVPAGGQLVATVAPGGIAVAAGMRRGDVITAVNGVPVSTPGGLTSAQRRLPAGRQVVVDTRRGAQLFPFQIAFAADWEKAPDFGPSLAVAVRRDPTKLAYAYAHARQLAEAGDAAAARAAIAGWRRPWQKSSAAHLLLGDLLYAENKPKEALGAYNRAIAADAQNVPALIGRGLALTALNRAPEAADAFAAATAVDTRNSAAFAYRAYALLRDGAARAPEALDAANRAVSLDRLNEDGHIARGLALIAAGRAPDGVQALKRGLLLLNDGDRARQLITDSLEPNDP
ncbi:MAG: PDZ domain-containing protein [Actinomycetota bacterium]